MLPTPSGTAPKLCIPQCPPIPCRNDPPSPEHSLKLPYSDPLSPIDATKDPTPPLVLFQPPMPPIIAPPTPCLENPPDISPANTCSGAPSLSLEIELDTLKPSSSTPSKHFRGLSELTLNTRRNAANIICPSKRKRRPRKTKTSKSPRWASSFRVFTSTSSPQSTQLLILSESCWLWSKIIQKPCGD